MTRRGSVARRVALAVMVVGIALQVAPSAQATVRHEQEGAFALSGLSFLGADNSADAFSGDIYVGEISVPSFESRVYRDDAAGVPTGFEFSGSETPAGSFSFVNLGTFHVASGPRVNGSTHARAGEIYVPDVTNGVVDIYGANGKYICQITGSATPSLSECAGAAGSETPRGAMEPIAVAVDPQTGALAVGDASGVIYEFNEAGEFEGEVADPHIIEPGELAFDSSGHLYVVNVGPFGSPGDLVKLGAGGAFERVVAPGRTSVAVDEVDDDVYAGSEGGEVAEFGPSGSRVASFGSGGRPIAVSKATEKVYLGSASGEGQIWSPGLPPSVTTGPPAAVGETTATLSGRVDPEIPAGGTPVESCQFEYGETTSYDHVAPCVPATPYSSATDVTADITGLSPASSYHYRLVAENAEGTTMGDDATVVTRGLPSVTGERATGKIRSATVRAEIDPFGYETSCEVQYADQEEFEAGEFAGASIAPCAETLNGFEPETAVVNLDGLDVGKTYHFRFVAHNAAGPATGAGSSFSTFAIDGFSVETLDREGNPYVQAGGHPYAMRVGIDFATTESEGAPGEPGTPGNLRTVRVELPPGLIGNPTAASTCAPNEMTQSECSPAAQVGAASVIFPNGDSTSGSVMNLDPPQGVAAQIGGRFNSFGTLRINAGIRTGADYGINAESLSITTDGTVKRFEMTLWGVPADPSHDPERSCKNSSDLGCPSGTPLVPFLTNPTACLGSLTSSISADTWQDPGSFASMTTEMPGIARCDRPDFKPTISAVPEVLQTDSASGLQVDLHVPQNQSPIGLAEANLKDTTVDLPAGLAVNPSGATGLAACSPAQIELHGPQPASCPDAAKIGTVEVDTPLLDHPLPGAVYIATPHDNPFGSLLAIYIAVDDPVSGVVVKLAGEVKADPQTGQLSTTFRENPQVPFEDFKLDFFGGPQAALTTPQTCGEYATTADMTPWTSPEGKDSQPSGSFRIGSGPNGSRCADTPSQEPHSPSFSAGTVTPLAGLFSPFVLNLSRQDGSQRLAAIDAQLPPGLIGRLDGIAYCPDAALAAAAAKSGADELASPSCPAASEVGSVDVGAGAGSRPYRVTGKAYLTGPYKGAPLGLAIVTPAVAGPFDLGNVVVRAALYVDRETAQITARSDALPTILQGIPLDVRSIALRMDRPRFTLNPTSCKPMAITATAFSVLGQGAPLSNRFQVGGCRGLAFDPKLRIRLFGATRRAGHPSLRATLTTKRGEANIARTAITLPASEFLDQNHIKTVCTRVQFNAGQCPRGSIYGRAKAWSPLLGYPLKGPVYLRSNGGERVLPDLVAALRGPAYQPLEIDLVGFIDSKGGGLRSRFEAVPDAPVSKFELSMQGGKKGLLVNSTNLCTAANRAAVKMRGQNGAADDFGLAVGNDCVSGTKSRGAGG